MRQIQMEKSWGDTASTPNGAERSGRGPPRGVVLPRASSEINARSRRRHPHKTITARSQKGDGKEREREREMDRWAGVECTQNDSGKSGQGLEATLPPQPSLRGVLSVLTLFGVIARKHMWAGRRRTWCEWGCGEYGEQWHVQRTRCPLPPAGEARAVEVAGAPGGASAGCEGDGGEVAAAIVVGGEAGEEEERADEVAKVVGGGQNGQRMWKWTLSLKEPMSKCARWVGAAGGRGEEVWASCARACGRGREGGRHGGKERKRGRREQR